MFRALGPEPSEGPPSALVAQGLQTSTCMDLHPVSFYAHGVKGGLPASVFRPATTRLLWLPVHLLVIASGTIAIARGSAPWPIVPVISVVIGMSFAGLMFLGHELLHGAIVRGRWAWVCAPIGWICFAPFALSQRLWVTWHNRVHHTTTNRLGADPDMYPSLEAYRASRRRRFAVDNFALGGRRKRGLLSLLFGFLVQSKAVLTDERVRSRMSTSELLQVIVETALAVGMWVAVAVLIGPVPFLFAFVIPLLVGDVIVMGFILTNHSLSPATEINDPLVNSLSVTAPRWLEWLTLHFGYHVEHHLFPAMSNRHARRLRGEVLERWPDRYQTMSVLSALHGLYRTGRVYKDPVTLIDPRTGGEWPTLAARAAS